jgi:uridine kinase
MDSFQQPLIIGIGGGTGSGKTTIAQGIVNELPKESVAYIQHDSYYKDRPDLSFEERAALNYDHPDSLDNELLIEHLDLLSRGWPAEIPIYDFVAHRRLNETRLIEHAPVVVVEGILIFAEYRLRRRFDIKLFVDTPADIRVLRRIRRDIEKRGRSFEEVRKQYYETVRPMHEAFVEPTKYEADLIVPEGGDRRVAVDLLVERIRRQIRLAPNMKPTQP